MPDNSATSIVAVVDDDPAVRKALTRLLHAAGYLVESFCSAEHFLEGRPHVDCAVVDIQLSGMTGIELERQMRVRGDDVPVVFITAHDDPGARAAALERGSCWLQKPFDARELLDAIAGGAFKRE